MMGTSQTISWPLYWSVSASCNDDQILVFLSDTASIRDLSKCHFNEKQKRSTIETNSIEENCHDGFDVDLEDL